MDFRRMARYLFIVVVIFMLNACIKITAPPLGIAQTFYPKAIVKFPLEKKEIILTIDDSPSDKTSEIIDLLNEYGATATFFVHTDYIDMHGDNERAELRLKSLEKIVASGSELANHMPYDYPSTKLKKEKFATLFKKADTRLDELEFQGVCEKGQCYKKYFRPANGLYNDDMLDSLSDKNYSEPFVEKGVNGYFVWASFLPWDAKETNYKDEKLNLNNADIYVNDMIKNIFPGAIVVFHDGEHGNRIRRLETTLYSLRIFLEKLKARGYRAVSLSNAYASLPSVKE